MQDIDDFHLYQFSYTVHGIADFHTMSIIALVHRDFESSLSALVGVDSPVVVVVAMVEAGFAVVFALITLVGVDSAVVVVVTMVEAGFAVVFALITLVGVDPAVVL